MTERITGPMLMAMIINMIYAKAIGITQAIMAREVGSDIWLATFLASVQGGLVMLLTVLAVRRMPGLSLVEQTESVLGKWGLRLMALCTFIFFIGAYGAMMITFVYHLMGYFLPGFPIIVFVIVSGAVTLYAAYQGIEVSGRIAILGVFFMCTMNLVILAGSVHDFDFHHLLPVFASEFPHVVVASRHNDTDWATATVMTGILLPLVAERKSWAKFACGGIAFYAIFVGIWPVLEVGMLTGKETGHYVVACMQMARSAEIGQFIHRYEMIMIFLFALSIFAQITTCLLCACQAVTHLVGPAHFRLSFIPVTVLFNIFGYYIVADHQRAMVFLTDVWPKFAIPFAVGLPVMLLLIGAFRKPAQASSPPSK